MLCMVGSGNRTGDDDLCRDVVLVVEVVGKMAEVERVDLLDICRNVEFAS